MNDTIKMNAVRLAEGLGGNRGKVLVELGSYIVSGMLARSESRKKRADILCRPGTVGWQYNLPVLNNFVNRRFTYYGEEKPVNINKIRTEIERQRYARNIILTGPAGSGKSTALKWLFLNSNMKGYTFLYLHAKMFNNKQDKYNSLQDVLGDIKATIEDSIESEKGIVKCVIFFDGLDELNCIQGTSSEFDELIEFFNERSCQEHYKFVISTRPEHFSFQKMIKEKYSKKTLDNYAVFEIEMLTKKESLLVCKSIEVLSKHENNTLPGVSHFQDKWPARSKAKSALSKAQYLHLLKEYLEKTTSEMSLLRSPLLCRYAYPIIREWNTQGHDGTDQSYTTQSALIRYALHAYIKWEFHDNYSQPTEGGEGKTLLLNYENKVFDFLTQIAGLMGLEDHISKQKWKEQAKEKKIHGNAAFCALQEYDDESMEFIHPMFKDYFLAIYYAKAHGKKHGIRSADFKNLTYLLKSNTEFSIMYVEQLAESKGRLVKRVLTFLLQGIAGKNFKILAELARGNTWYIYTSDSPFTVEEYLRIFPHGGLKYNGIFFDRKVLDKLFSTGILETENIEDLINCKINKISSNISIKGVVNIPIYWKGFKHTKRSFYIVNNKCYINIGGYWMQNTYGKDLRDILRREEFQEKLSKSTATTAQIDAVIQDAIREKKIQDEFRRSNEDSELRQRINYITTFIGANESYWCLFDEGALYVYRIIPENERLMNELFREGLSKNFSDYLSLYGEYTAIMEPNDELIYRARFCETRSLSLTFDASQSVVNPNTTVLSSYYSIHWKNLKLLKTARNKDGNLREDINRLLDIYIILAYYKVADESLKNFPNEKLKLFLKDEELITYYAMGDGDNMVALAEETLELCEKYQHEMGIALRKFLIADNTGFTGEDFEKVYKFARNYIWL